MDLASKAGKHLQLKETFERHSRVRAGAPLQGLAGSLLCMRQRPSAGSALRDVSSRTPTELPFPVFVLQGGGPAAPSASEHCSDPSCIENIVPESPDADTSLSQCCGLGEITAMWWLFSASRVGLKYVRMRFIAGVHIRDADHQSQRELRRKLQM